MIRRIDDGAEAAFSVDPDARDGSPLGRSPSGEVDAGSGGADAGRAIVSTARRILEIVPGERRLLAAFGCRIHALDDLHRSEARELAAGLVEEALERWVPALGVERVEVREARGGWIRVALSVASRWHEFDIKHRRHTSAPQEAAGRRAPPFQHPEAPPA